MKWQSVALPAIVAVVASGAIALAGPICPSAQSSTNPIRSFHVQGTTKGKQVFTVPAGQVFIVTDLVLSRSKPTSHLHHFYNTYEVGCLLVNGVETLCTDRANFSNGTRLTTAHLRLQTGTAVASGSKISLSVHGSHGAGYNLLHMTITGYLARP